MSSDLIEAIAAAVLGARFHDEPVSYITSSTAREAIAPAILPVVAAELRRLAETWSDKPQPAFMNVPSSYVRAHLLRRADELDGSA